MFIDEYKGKKKDKAIETPESHGVPAAYLQRLLLFQFPSRLYRHS
jgi:hypothetical protein